MKLVLIIFIAIFPVACNNNKESIQSILQNKILSDEIICKKITKIILGNSLKNFSVKKINNKIVLNITIGNDSALTTLSSSNYAETYKSELAIYLLQLFQLLENRNLYEIVISIRKPFYISGSSKIDNFKIYETTLNIDQINQLKNWRIINPKNISLKNLEIIQKLWVVQVDEFYRIELD